MSSTIEQKQGHLGNLDDKSDVELKDLLRRQQQLVTNK